MMNMQPLPNQPSDASDFQKQDAPVVSGSMAKEAEPHIAIAETFAPTETAKDFELTKEVQDAGVKLQQVEIDLPDSVKHMGVQAIAHTQAVSSVPTAQLPLTDAQIAQGLGQSITSSVRWLAEWCRRQAKMALVSIQTIHGKISGKTVQ